MDDASGNKGRKTGDGSGGAQERRMPPDRRSGLDRRGSGTSQPHAKEPRGYVFRDFADRRNPQDRRLFVVTSRPNERSARLSRASIIEDDDGFCRLSREQLLRLLSEFDD